MAPAASRWSRSDADVSRYQAVTPATDVPGNARILRSSVLAPSLIGLADGVTSAVQSPPPSARGRVVVAMPGSRATRARGARDVATQCSGERARTRACTCRALAL